MYSIDIFKATLTWYHKNEARGPSNMILRVIPFLFLTLDSLVKETRKLPIKSIAGKQEKKIVSSHRFTLGVFLDPDEYSKLRSILSLLGDIYNLSDALREDRNILFELAAPIDRLYSEARKYYQIRNFFTHLGQVLGDPITNGLDGPYKTKSGIEYLQNTKGNSHLLWDKNSESLFFTIKKKEYENRIKKDAFNGLFSAGNDLCKELGIPDRFIT